MREPQTGSGFSLRNLPAFIAWELTNIFNGCREWIWRYRWAYPCGYTDASSM
jgi:hypothetical protein